MSRVYLGRLSFHAREKDVERFFKGYGRLREINLKNGFGFVEFDDQRDADDAVFDLNGRELCGERVTVEHARGASRGGGGGGWGRDRDRDYYEPPRRRGGGIDKYGPPRRTDFRVIVENLSSRVSWQDLKDYMRQAGEVTFADAHKQKQNEGIVEFATSDDMENAIKKLDGTDLNGRMIKIIDDSPRGRRRSRSRSRGRSRSKSRSRSRSRRRSRSKSASRSPRRSRSRSRSQTPRKSRSKSPSPRNGDRSRSRSKSRSKSPAQED